MKQLDLYKKMDALFTVETRSLDKKAVHDLVATNSNARDYFFSKAPVDWIGWFYSNGFFDILSVEAEDKTGDTFVIPELGYLTMVVETGGDEDKVVEIMNKADCVKNFNPKVVKQFLLIAQKL